MRIVKRSRNYKFWFIVGHVLFLLLMYIPEPTNCRDAGEVSGKLRLSKGTNKGSGSELINDKPLHCKVGPLGPDKGCFNQHQLESLVGNYMRAKLMTCFYKYAEFDFVKEITDSGIDSLNRNQEYFSNKLKESISDWKYTVGPYVLIFVYIFSFYFYLFSPENRKRSKVG